MHMSDALVSAPVAVTAGIAAAALIVVASRKVSAIRRDDIVPLMGVMGAFVFAAQMINFSIPGTGSSGHIIGGVLLAALMGPWAAFLTLTSVLIIQCFLFADGGMMALGCNIINMGAMSALLAWPLVYRPIAANSSRPWRLMLASVAACVVALEAGAFLVTLETELSGVTALPSATFLSFMLPIHLAIGACEGVATGLLLLFVARYKPDMLFRGNAWQEEPSTTTRSKRRTKFVLCVFAILSLIFATTFTWMASGNPDGLEWSVAHVAGAVGLADSAVPSTAVMPDYDSTFSGLVGGGIVVLMLWGICSILFRRRHVKA